ncbi:hypothetical protein BLNAU_9122 [Blattamonas nauphoetae]|uniref:Uncharacterized protein n=1 Tax=Blattamonas nauphoetae TaxID=2049346 RepID=A0ABQ9XWU7_9EUKA|nr:hypothetical protein BLNAU_9122 [Blattamonas nauphoetae]
MNLAVLVMVIQSLFPEQPAARIHPFLLRGLHLIEPPEKAQFNQISTRAVISPLLPSEWDTVPHNADSQVLQSQLRLLLTLALPETFPFPLGPLIPRELWFGSKFNGKVFSIVPNFDDEVDFHALVTLAVIRRYLSPERIQILPVLQDFFGHLSPSVTTAALILVRSIVGHRNDTWNRRLIRHSVFELVVREVERSSHLDDFENGVFILSELLRTAQKGIVEDDSTDDDVSLGSV